MCVCCFLLFVHILLLCLLSLTLTLSVCVSAQLLVAGVCLSIYCFHLLNLVSHSLCKREWCAKQFPVNWILIFYGVFYFAQIEDTRRMCEREQANESVSENERASDIMLAKKNRSSSSIFFLFWAHRFRSFRIPISTAHTFDYCIITTTILLLLLLLRFIFLIH